MGVLVMRELLRITLIVVFIILLIKCCKSENAIEYLIDSSAYYKEYADSVFSKP